MINEKWSYSSLKTFEQCPKKYYRLKMVQDVRSELGRQGMAWVYRKYAKDESLFDLEQEAQDESRRLWSLPELQRVPPWEWRRGN